MIQAEQAILKHLPPSSATLRLLKVGAALDQAALVQRRDLDVTTIDGAAADWQFAPASFDAVVGHNLDCDEDFLAAALQTLRPGGRLIVLQSQGQAGQAEVARLESAGYTRILVEALHQYALLRGEKPHGVQRTVDRIRQVADQQPGLSRPYVHLLIRQTPNKPVWALHPDEQVEWQAVALADDDGLRLLAFSSLPKAVAFMQPAVMQGLIVDVNKVGKFSRETALSWPLPLVLDPALDSLDDRRLATWAVDPQTAEQPDE